VLRLRGLQDKMPETFEWQAHKVLWGGFVRSIRGVYDGCKIAIAFGWEKGRAI